MLFQTVGLRVVFLSALCSCAGITVAANAASSEAPPDAKGFVELAAQDGMTEVQLGEIALRNSKNPHVHKFAQRMIEDHGKANGELVGIAQQKNLIVAKRLDPKHTALVQELSGKLGMDFDTAYAKTMADAHADAVALFQRESKGNDPQLSAFAKQMLPTLTEHKRMADELNATFTAATPH
jgi:putative membrane protein